MSRRLKSLRLSLAPLLTVGVTLSKSPTFSQPQILTVRLVGFIRESVDTRDV